MLRSDGSLTTSSGRVDHYQASMIKHPIVGRALPCMVSSEDRSPIARHMAPEALTSPRDRPDARSWSDSEQPPGVAGEDKGLGVVVKARSGDLSCDRAYLAAQRPGIQVCAESHPVRTEAAREVLDEAPAVRQAGVEDEVRCHLGGEKALLGTLVAAERVEYEHLGVGEGPSERRHLPQGVF